jgi:cytochrome c553
MTTKTALLATLALAVLACQKQGDGSTPPTTGGEATDTPTDTGDTPASDGGGGEAKVPPGAPDVQWADKTFQQRKEWMGIEVLPKMKASFKAYDETQFKAFGCDTCHGADGKDKNYAMPTDSIYPLDKNDPVGKAMDYDAKVTQFMVDKVVPEMAAMIGAEPYDPKTGKGTFGCLSCHPAE